MRNSPNGERSSLLVDGLVPIRTVPGGCVESAIHRANAQPQREHRIVVSKSYARRPHVRMNRIVEHQASGVSS